MFHNFIQHRYLRAESR